MSAKAVSPKAVPAKKGGKTPVKPVKSLKNIKAAPAADTNHISEWLQDASIEVPVPAGASYVVGQRELEFSVGMRQQEDGDAIRSELRARALIHAAGQVLAMVEASYVVVLDEVNMRPDLPQYLYTKLKPHLEGLFALSGHTPPLPQSLENAVE